MAKWTPTIVTRCVDCGLGCNAAHEWYRVCDRVWELAWRGRRKPWQILVPGQMALCIGCLENRLGRTLCARDFTDAMVNDPNKENVSERIRQRLTATQWRRLGMVPADAGPVVSRKRGRPKGSKNKPKPPTDADRVVGV